MKLDDFAYAIVQKVFSELEHAHHFAVPEPIRKATLEAVIKNLNTLVK